MRRNSESRADGLTFHVEAVTDAVQTPGG